MKVIFVDIDGVLNNYATQTKYHNNYVPLYSDLDPKCMSNFRTLLQIKSDYQILIHSAWREHTGSMQFKEIFAALGFSEIADRIIGITDSSMSKQDSIHDMIKLMGIKQFIIIDDDILFDLGTEMYSRQYKTSLFTGLTARDIERISSMMN